MRVVRVPLRPSRITTVRFMYAFVAGINDVPSSGSSVAVTPSDTVTAVPDSLRVNVQFPLTSVYITPDTPAIVTFAVPVKLPPVASIFVDLAVTATEPDAGISLPLIVTVSGIAPMITAIE